MPAYDYICKNEHITEIYCSIDTIPKHVTCSTCHEPAVRSYKNMGIKSHVKYGTGGGRDMKQS